MEQKQPETWEKRFVQELVEMNLFLGRDMQNRPPLYETSDEKVEEIKEFIKREINTARLEAAREERVKVSQEFEQAFSREYCTRIECIDPKEIIQSIKNNV